ncbi:MAG: sugar ABC transporter substrate-binding protein [Treponemataceae bacterium]
MTIVKKSLLCLVALTSLSLSGTFAQNKKELIIMTRVGPENDAIKALIPEYEQISGMKIKVDETGKEGFQQRQTTRLMAGDNLDVVMYMSDFGPLFAASKLLTPLNKYTAKPAANKSDADMADFYPATLNAFKYKNELYGLPTDVSTWLLYYNKKMIPNPPTTYAEIPELAKKWTKRYNASSPTSFGTQEQSKSGSESPVNEWLAVLWAMGGELFDAKNKPIFNNEIGIKSLTYKLDLFSKDHVVPDDTPAMDAAAVIEGFRQENVAFYAHWNSNAVIFADPKASPKVAGTLGVALIPGVAQKDGSIKRVPVTHGWAVGIPSSSKKKDDAFKFIQWLTGKHAGQKYLAAGGTPARISILQNPDNLKIRPELGLVGQSLNFARPKPAIKEWPQISDILQQAHASVIGEGKPVKASLDEAAARINDLMKKAGYYK